MKKQFIQCVQNSNENVSPEQTIHAIKNAGFDGAFVQWYDKDLDFSQQDQVDLCKKLGLKIEFAHLGYHNMNSIWLPGEEGENLTKQYLQDLQECKNNNIPMVVIHLQGKKTAPAPNKIGLERFKRVVDYANSLNIKVAFENTKIQGYLEYIIDNIPNKNCGICLDSGHLHCHFKDKLNWKKFKDKIFAVHLHDNEGEWDQHLLPYDGTIDWNWFMSNLEKANYNGPITLESCYRNEYLMTPIDKFYEISLDKAKQLYSVYEKQNLAENESAKM